MKLIMQLVLIATASLSLLFLEITAISVPPIVDGGGYRIEKHGLCMTSMSSEDSGSELGLVQTVPWTNGMNQKWTVEIFGRSDISLTPSNNKRNNVTYTLTPLLSSITYEINLDQEKSQFRIRNKQEKLCLQYGKLRAVSLGSCNSDASLWTFFRTG